MKGVWNEECIASKLISGVKGWECEGEGGCKYVRC